MLRTNQEPPFSDLPAWIFLASDWRTQIIELRQYDPVRHRRSYEDDHPVHSEPPVPFKWVEDREFSLAGVTHMLLAHSPEYTPIEANELLPVIRKYFYPL